MSGVSFNSVSFNRRCRGKLESQLASPRPFDQLSVQQVRVPRRHVRRVERSGLNLVVHPSVHVAVVRTESRVEEVIVQREGIHERRRVRPQLREEHRHLRADRRRLVRGHVAILQKVTHGIVHRRQRVERHEPIHDTRRRDGNSRLGLIHRVHEVQQHDVRAVRLGSLDPRHHVAGHGLVGGERPGAGRRGDDHSSSRVRERFE
mmetsp:Transcript_1771/g.7927  ORF Transcript_1771/g.7927 Transcript_1771/m.7927 type:complete len:204 (+) Transcript_1771:542-1153(+)